MKVLIKQLELKDFLSFGPDSPPVELGALNVLIGPNGSGKSNLLTALAFLHKLPEGIEKAMPMLGDRSSLVWNRTGLEFAITADFGAHPIEHKPKYQIGFRVSPSNQYWLLREQLLGETDTDRKTGQTLDAPEVVRYYNSNGSYATILDASASEAGGEPRRIDEESGFKTEETILAQRAYQVEYPLIHHVADSLKLMAIFRSWPFGWESPVRKAQTTSQAANRVEEDWSNYQLVLNRICGEPKVKAKVLKYLNALAPGLSDIGLDTLGGAGTLRITEGERNVTMDRLSDGTLRVLALLAVFCHPKPPPLIVFEEPELGLHPDMIPTVAELLRDASDRTQVLVTTHSRDLIDCFTATPDVVLVCEKVEGQTHIQKAHAPGLTEILGRKSLGRVWSEGHIGGNRW